jgi:site-specific DNA-methyltransferase (adenine-specific)
MQPTWQSDNVKLYLGDCYDILPSIAADAVVTDPPYGISHNTNYKRFTGGKSQSRNFGKPIAGDDEPFDPTPFLRFKKVILWGANCFSDKLTMGTWLVWCKRRDSQLGKFMSDCEVGWQKGGHGSYLFHHVWNGFDRESERGKTLHPTQKPTRLFSWCIERLKLKPGATIFDPFMGSAPVAQAAIELGFNYIGVEKEPQHFDTAVKRIESLALAC